MNVIVKDILKSRNGYSYLKLHPTTFTQLGLEKGDCVEVVNHTSGHHTAAQLYEEKNNGLEANQVLISWYASQNLAAIMGDSLTLRKIYPRDANFVQLTEVNNQITNVRNIEQLTEKLQKFIITRGDMISFQNKHTNCIYALMVMRYEPECDAVIIRENTKIKIGF